MHCDARALSLVSLVFGEVFFGGSPSLHDLFLHFLAKLSMAIDDQLSGTCSYIASYMF